VPSILLFSTHVVVFALAVLEARAAHEAEGALIVALKSGDSTALLCLFELMLSKEELGLKLESNITA
jgi:hypothetical protein